MSIGFIAAFLTALRLRCDEYGSGTTALFPDPRRNHVDVPPGHQPTVRAQADLARRSSRCSQTMWTSHLARHSEEQPRSNKGNGQ